MSWLSLRNGYLSAFHGVGVKIVVVSGMLLRLEIDVVMRRGQKTMAQQSVPLDELRDGNRKGSCLASTGLQTRVDSNFDGAKILRPHTWR